jgi:hypothetical protein
MAWKSGQSYSADLRSRVLAGIDGGMPAEAVAERFRVSVSCIDKALGRRAATGEVEARPQRSHQELKPSSGRQLGAPTHARASCQHDKGRAEACPWWPVMRPARMPAMDLAAASYLAVAPIPCSRPPTTRQERRRGFRASGASGQARPRPLCASLARRRPPGFGGSVTPAQP